MDSLMTVNEAAAYLKLCPVTIYRKTTAGTLPHLRIGRSIRFVKDDLDAYIRSLAPENASVQPTTVPRAPVTRL